MKKKLYICYEMCTYLKLFDFLINQIEREHIVEYKRAVVFGAHHAHVQLLVQTKVAKNGATAKSKVPTIRSIYRC
jgi:hypothetical protein